MLIHITPRLFACRVNEPECDLVDVQIPELDLILKNGVELAARRPYPNKHYLVACRKVGRKAKAMEGFMVETSKQLARFSVTTRWAVGGERLVSHRVQYIVLDDDYSAISDDMALWREFGSEELGSWSNRWPPCALGWTPAGAQPRMELTQRERQGEYQDRIENGQIVFRDEKFLMHTIEPERIKQRSIMYDRIPQRENAFLV